MPNKAATKPKTAAIKNKGGRPPKLLPDDKTIGTIRALGTILCTTREVAAVLQVTEPTLFAFWAKHPETKVVFEDAKESGKASLRRHMFELSKKNATMGIFLALNILGMKDRREHTGPGGGPIAIDVNDLRNMTDEQLDALEARMTQRQVNKTTGA